MVQEAEVRGGTVPAETWPAAAPAQMPCMEVWGGNRAANNGVMMPGLDLWLYCRPFGDQPGGGDVYLVSTCATGRITRLLLADVAGHGEVVDTLAAELRRLMQRYVNYVEQTALVRAINRAFALATDSGRFATAVVATYWSPTRDLELSVAGHPRPMWYRAARRRWDVIELPGPAPAGSNIPLGIAGPTPYSTGTIRLGPSDLLLLYTDAVIESRSTEGRVLGERGLGELLASIDADRGEEVVAELVSRLDAWRGGRPPEDDLTLLLVRPNSIGFRRMGRDWTVIARRARQLMREAMRPGGAPFPWPQWRVDNILGAFVERMNRCGRPPLTGSGSSSERRAAGDGRSRAR